METWLSCWNLWHLLSVHSWSGPWEWESVRNLGLERGRGMYAVMNAYIGQCDWLSNIFTIGMIFLTQKKKKNKICMFWKLHTCISNLIQSKPWGIFEAQKVANMLDNVIFLKNLTCQLLFNHDLGFIWMGKEKKGGKEERWSQMGEVHKGKKIIFTPIWQA